MSEGGIPETRTASVTDRSQGTPRQFSRCPPNKVVVGMQWRRGASADDPFLKGVDFIECASIDDIMLNTLPRGVPRTLATLVPVTRVNINQGEAGGQAVHRRCGAGTMIDSIIVPRIEMDPHRIAALSSTTDGETLEIPVGLCRAVIPNCDSTTLTTPAAWNQCMSADLEIAGAWMDPRAVATPSGAAMHGSQGFFSSISRGFNQAVSGVRDISRTIGNGIATTFTSTIPDFVVSSANTVADGTVTAFDATVDGLQTAGEFVGQSIGVIPPPAPPDVGTNTSRIGCDPENATQRLAGTHQGIVGIQISTGGDSPTGPVTNITVECGTVSRTPPIAAFPVAASAADATTTPSSTGVQVPTGGAVSLGALGQNIGGDANGEGGIPLWVIIAAVVALLIIIIIIVVAVVLNKKPTQ